jgi:hypothetical protein
MKIIGEEEGEATSCEDDNIIPGGGEGIRKKGVQGFEMQQQK